MTKDTRKIARQYIRDIKSKKTCTCGESNPDLLEFAHCDRESKLCENGRTVDLSSMSNIDKINTELEKGRFLCIFCHREETQEENKQTTEFYFQHLVETATRSISDEDNSHFCNGLICAGRRTKNIFKYNKSKCDSCSALSKCLRRIYKNKLNNNEKIKRQKCEFCLKKCEVQTTHLFEWDHIFGKNKKVSKILDKTDKCIINEILLCRLLCAKCHRTKSIKESRGLWTE